MDCKITVLPNPPLKNHSVKCSTFEETSWKAYNDKLCVMRTLALHLHGIERLEEETSKLFKQFLEKTGGTDPANFWDVCIEDIAIVEEIVQADFFLNDIDFVDVSMVGKLARRSVRKHSNTVRLLRFDSHICYDSNVNALFKAHRCVSCHQLINKTDNLEQHLTTCKERLKHILSKNVYQLRETLLDKLDSLNIPYSDDQKLFKKWQYSILTQFVCRKTNSAILILPIRLTSTFQYLYQVRPTWLNYQNF